MEIWWESMYWYVIIEEKKILYYYDFRDECVYCIDGGETSKNAEKGARKGGYYGGIIGIFCIQYLEKQVIICRVEC